MFYFKSLKIFFNLICFERVVIFLNNSLNFINILHQLKLKFFLVITLKPFQKTNHDIVTFSLIKSFQFLFAIFLNNSLNFINLLYQLKLLFFHVITLKPFLKTNHDFVTFSLIKSFQFLFAER